MTLTVLLIALAHAIPIFLVRLVTKRGTALTVAAAVMAMVAFAIGSPSYVLFDLVAIGFAYYICYSSPAGQEYVPAPSKRIEPPRALKYDANSASSFGALFLIVLGIGIYFLFFFDKPAPRSVLSPRLEAFASMLKAKQFNENFVLVDATVKDNTLYMSFVSNDQPAGDAIARYSGSDLGREYAAYYCTTQPSAALLAEGAQIVVALLGSDSRPIGRYSVSESSCQALRPSATSVARPSTNTWQQVGATHGGATGYVDPTTVRRSGTTATMADLMDFKRPRTAPKGQVYLSQKNRREYDCQSRRIRIHSFTLHSRSMGEGEVVFSASKTGEWTPITNGKAAESMWNVACSGGNSTTSTSPPFQAISRCFFVYAAIFQAGRDHSHAELMQFAQARLDWTGGYIEANKSNQAFKRIFEADLEANKQVAMRIENTLVTAMNTQDPTNYARAMREAVSCDQAIGIETRRLPTL